MSSVDPRELRRELSKHEGGVGRRYPVALKERVIAYAAHRRATGASFLAIARELGMQMETVRRWCGHTVPTPVSTTLLPVEVISSSASSIAIVSPNGFRLEGLDLDDAVAAMRAFG